MPMDSVDLPLVQESDCPECPVVLLRRQPPAPPKDLPPGVLVGPGDVVLSPPTIHDPADPPHNWKSLAEFYVDASSPDSLVTIEREELPLATEFSDIRAQLAKIVEKRDKGKPVEETVCKVGEGHFVFDML